MTNREWLAQHPEKMNETVWYKAWDYCIDKYGTNATEHRAITVILEEWFNAEHQEPEKTHITTIEITKVFKGREMQPITKDEQRRLCQHIKEYLRADDVKVAKIQIFERDAE